MTLLPLLLLAQLGASGGDHAGLHPADAQVFVQVPDLQRVFGAYPDAPLFRLLEDPELRAFAADVAQEDPESFHIMELVERRALESLDTFPAQIQQAISLAGEARSLSFSVTTTDTGALFADAREVASGGALAEVVGRHVGLLCVMDFGTAEAAEHAAEMIAQAPGTRIAEGGELAELRVGDAPGRATRLELEGLGPRLGYWTLTSGGTLAVGVGNTTPAGLARRAGDPALALSGSARYAQGLTEFAPAEGVTLYETYLQLENVSVLIDAATADMPEPGRSMAGGMAKRVLSGDSVRRHSRQRLVGGRFVSEALGSDGDPEEGLFGFLGREPVDAQALAMVPPDAVAAWVVQLDADALLERAMSMVTSFSGEDPGVMLAQLDDTYGLRPAEDIVSALGTRSVVYMLPITGLTLPKVHAAVELRDPEAFKRGMEGLARLAEGASGGEVRVETRPYRNVPLFTFAPKRSIGELAGDVGAPQQFVSLAPGMIDPEVSIAVLGDRALVGLSAMNVKREIKRLMGKGAEAEAHALFGPGSGLPADATSVSFVDWASILGGLYTTFRTFVPMIAQAVPDLPFDPEALPEPGLFTRHFRPTVSWERRTDAGCYQFSESSFGPEVPVSLLAAGAAALLIGSSTGPPPGELELVVVETSEPVSTDGDKDEARRDRTVGALRELKLAIVMYRADTGHAPERLEQLTEPRPAYPQGFLDGAAVPTDGWDRPFRYTVSAADGSWTLWSLGPDGIDQAGAADDIALD